MNNRGTVMVVDDTLASLKLLTQLLAREGYQVRPADSGELALASVAASPPELILLDIRMPGMDGFEVIRRLKAQMETREIPVIFLSAVTEVDQRVEGLKLGAVDFISKPFQREELLARVRTHIELCRLRTKAENLAIEVQRANDQLEVDISERKRVEEALQQMNKKLTMLNNITRHDILNQLMGLRTYLELSKENVKDPVILGYIQKEEQAAEAIQWQIEFTRNYQDIGGQEAKWQDLSDTINSAVGQLKPPGVEINVATNRVEIFADPILEKVFYNLMENSLRHGDHVTRMDFSVKETENWLILSYCDNGVGVNAEDKKKLFQKGFGKHTGLGLFLSREILSITGITITENGEPGRGARFEMTVPKGGYRLTGTPTSE